MILINFIFLFFGLGMLKPSATQQEFKYKTFDCLGLKPQSRIMFENKKVGTLFNIVPGRDFCSGTILIDADFILLSQMSFYRVDPVFGKPYIKIKLTPQSDAKHSISVDTIIIK